MKTRLGPGCQLLIGLCLVLLPVAGLQGDGGAVVLQEEAGPYRVTGFALPVPPRAGPVDFSFYVEDSTTGRAVLDAEVEVAFYLAPGDEMEGGRRWLPPCCLMDGGESIGTPQRAFRERGGNRLLYEVIALIPEPGVWGLQGTIRRNAEEHRFASRVAVGPPSPPLISYWPLLAFPMVVVGLFSVAQRLRMREGGHKSHN